MTTTKACFGHSLITILETKTISQKTIPAALKALKLVHILTTFVAVFKTISPPKVTPVTRSLALSQEAAPPPPPHPAAAALAQVMPGVYRLMAAVNSIWSPGVRRRLPPSLAPMLGATRSHIEMEVGEAFETSLAYAIHKWVINVAESSFALLTIACSLGEPFYVSLTPETITSSVLSQMRFLELRHLRTLIDKFFIPFCKNCPPHLFHSLLGPVMHGMLNILFLRLNEGWGLYEQRKKTDDKGEEKREIAWEESLREVTRSACDLVLKTIALPDGSAIGTSVKRPSTLHSSTNPNLLADNKHACFFLGTESVYKPLFSTLTSMLLWPDSTAGFKAIKVWCMFVPALSERPHLHCYLQDALQASVINLQTTQTKLEDTGGWGAMMLVKEIYQRMIPISTIPRRLFAAIPGMDLQDLENLEVVLRQIMAEKKYRQAVKSFLMKYIVNGGEGRQAAARQIMDLPESLVVLKKQSSDLQKAREWEDDNYVLPDLFA